MRLFCATGPGNLTEDFKAWSNKETRSQESLAKTYSSEMFDFCSSNQVELMAISSHPNAKVVFQSHITCENLPKPEIHTGLRFHLNQMAYGLLLLKRARNFQADVAIIDSGSCSWWVAILFRLSGIKVVMKLHNALWAAHHKPKGWPRLKAYLLDLLPMKLSVDAVLGVSQECIVQAKSVLSINIPAQSFLPIYDQERIKKACAKKSGNKPTESNLIALFCGRMEISKGALLFLQAAKITTDRHPSLYRFVMVGDGFARDSLQKYVDENGLQSCVELKGHLDAESVLKEIIQADVLIMPTTSSFPEALGKSMIEAALANTPSIVSRVVPGSELLSKSCIVVNEDDESAIAHALLYLAGNRQKLYELSLGNVEQKAEFFNASNGLNCALEKILKTFS